MLANFRSQSTAPTSISMKPHSNPWKIRKAQQPLLQTAPPMQLGMESKLKVTATARHFFHDPSIRGLFQKHGVQLQETAYGGELDDSRIDSVEMLQIANGSDALIIGKAPISREVISGMPRLKIISVRGVGYDGIDLGAAAEKGVELTITPGAVDDAVAE